MTDVLVLCYHAVSPTWTSDISVTPDDLERQVRALRARGYVATTFTRALTAPPAPRTVAITFDDAFRSVFTIARPILDRFGLPATLYVPTAPLDGGGRLSWPGIDQWAGTDDERELAACTWDEVRELRDHGWEIGSHTRSHPRLTQVTATELREELEGSRADLEERMGERCRSLAYPYGDCDVRVVQAARDAGYENAASLPTRLAPRPERHEWPRVNVGRGMSDRTFRSRTSATIRRVAASPAWPLIEATVQGFRRAQGRLGN